MGLSGGADSSYALVLACRRGLRPLVVHVDNGWNSEIAVINIERLVKNLKLDLFTWVIDWEVFRDLQRSLFLAGVVDLELPSDHAILAGMYRVALKFGIRYIVTGDNFTTEATLPPAWNHPKTDLTNLLAIHRAFSGRRLDTFPTLSTLQMLALQRLVGIKTVQLLSYYPYNKLQAKAQLARAYDWRDCGGKHHESIITRFYQGVILPKKFGIDKRKLHLSRLICSRQITREQALAELALPHYPLDLQQQDEVYFIKKMGLDKAQFQAVMEAPPRSHFDYPSDRRILYRLFHLKKLIRPRLSH